MPTFMPDYLSKGDHWNPEITGEPQLDLKAGEAFAAEAFELARRIGRADKPHGPEFLARVLSDMVRRGRFSPVEVGFLYAVARKAYAGAYD